MRRLALPSLVATTLLSGACGLLVGSDSISYPMDLDPQEFKHDFGADFRNQMGTFPAVDCAGNAAACNAIPAQSLPSGATASCDTGTGKCIAKYDVRLPVPVNLAQQTSLPPAVASSGVVNSVQVSAVRYWTAANSLKFDLPAIELYVGGQTAMKETDAGVTRLGTLPSIQRDPFKTACAAGTPGTKATACDMPLTDDGKRVLGTLARDFKTPFNVLLVAHLVLRGGDPFPSGELDLFVQPQIAFVIPL